MEQKHSGTNVNETNNSNSGEELIKQTEIEGTPFKKIETAAGNWIALGQYRLTDLIGDVELELKVMELQRTDWQMMIAIIGAVTNQTVLTYKGEL